MTFPVIYQTRKFDFFSSVYSFSVLQVNLENFTTHMVRNYNLRSLSVCLMLHTALPTYMLNITDKQCSLSDIYSNFFHQIPVYHQKSKLQNHLQENLHTSRHSLSHSDFLYSCLVTMILQMCLDIASNVHINLQANTLIAISKSGTDLFWRGK